MAECSSYQYRWAQTYCQPIQTIFENLLPRVIDGIGSTWRDLFSLSRVGVGEAQEQRHIYARDGDEQSLILCSIAATAIRCDVRPHGFGRGSSSCLRKVQKKVLGWIWVRSTYAIKPRWNFINFPKLLCSRYVLNFKRDWRHNVHLGLSFVHEKVAYSFHNNKLGSCLRAFLMKNVESSLTGSKGVVYEGWSGFEKVFWTCLSELTNNLYMLRDQPPGRKSPSHQNRSAPLTHVPSSAPNPCARFTFKFNYRVEGLRPRTPFIWHFHRLHVRPMWLRQ